MDETTINSRIQTLESMGFNVILGKYVYSQDGYLAAIIPYLDYSAINRPLLFLLFLLFKKSRRRKIISRLL